MVKIKSKNDVITNSSDEAYIVKINIDASEAKRLFYDYMEENHYEEWHSEWPDLEPGRVVKTKDGVVFDWPILCNLENAYSYLCDVFGKENVESCESLPLDLDFSLL